MANPHDPKETVAIKDPDYEEVGAEILASHAREEMHARVASLRRHLKAAFSETDGLKAKRRKPESDD